jgi:hypothetical protein
VGDPNGRGAVTATILHECGHLLAREAYTFRRLKREPALALAQDYR